MFGIGNMMPIRRSDDEIRAEQFNAAEDALLSVQARLRTLAVLYGPLRELNDLADSLFPMRNKLKSLAQETERGR